MQTRHAVLKSLCTSHVSGLVEDFLTFASSCRSVLMRIMELRGKLEYSRFSAVSLWLSRSSLRLIAKSVIRKQRVYRDGQFKSYRTQEASQSLFRLVFVSHCDPSAVIPCDPHIRDL